MSTFNDFCFDAPILKMLGEIGYVTPTAIQEIAIPKILDGRDVVASAQTGTGKTGAFLLPALQTLLKSPKENHPRILILAPTRELAMQIASEAEKFSKHLRQIKTVCIYGGVPYPPQKRALSKPYDILVATPGRLMDHMDRGLINLSHVKILVLDEADRMLDMGFLEPVEMIAKTIGKNRQTLMFSATIDKKILQISHKLQKNAEEIKIAPDVSAENNIEQKIFFADSLSHKIRLLDHFLENIKIDQALIFTSTKRHAGELAYSLQEKGRRAEALHGDMNQRQRSRTVEKLRKKQINIVVATDVAARGIDIPSLSLVINLDLPFKPEDYIHRIGRTGRAGAKGDAITLVSRQDRPMLARIQLMLGKQLALHTVAGLEPQMKQEHRPKRGGPSNDRRPRGNFPKRRGGYSPSRRSRNA